MVLRGTKLSFGEQSGVWGRYAQGGRGGAKQYMRVRDLGRPSYILKGRNMWDGGVFGATAAHVELIGPPPEVLDCSLDRQKQLRPH